MKKDKLVPAATLFPEADRGSEQRWGTTKILVASDNPVSRFRIREMLGREGYRVYEADEARWSDELLVRTDGLRMAVLDLASPGMNGDTLCQTLRTLRTEHGRSYVYVLLMASEESKEEELARGLDAGADDYISMPNDFVELKARLGIGRRILQLQDKLLHETRHDALTQLPNRKVFLERVEACVKKARLQKDYNFAVLFLGIDRFKSINASFGQKAGDELILQLSRRLAGSIRVPGREERASRMRSPGRQESGDLLARLAGDEFAILLDGIRDTSDTVRVADRIQTRLNSPFAIAGHMLLATVSIGIASSDTRYATGQDVLRDADTAMYRAKTVGYSRYEICDPVVHSGVIARLKLENDLRGAIDHDEFLLFYQPIYSLTAGRAVGMEALIRWQRAGQGSLVTPAEFIPVAEETGLIVPIGRWALREACRQIRIWQERFPHEQRLTVAVNVSAKQLAQSDFVDEVAQALRDSGIAPSSLKLELTETVAMRDTEQAASVLSKLIALGIGMCIDDFGTGYSSFAYLRRFRFSTLKLDRAFVSEIEDSPEDFKIAQAIVSVGRNLEMDVVAEGVETPGQVDLLRAIGCHYAQGYHFAKPMEARDAESLLSLSGATPDQSCGTIRE
jgi:diguanylate cyclase (GGDEF)-like protein